MKQTRDYGSRMRTALQKIADRFPDRSLQVRGKGMMQALDFGDGSLARQITADCFEAGLLVGPCGSGGRVIKLIPPLTIPDSDLQEGLEIFTAAAIRRLEAA